LVCVNICNRDFKWNKVIDLISSYFYFIFSLDTYKLFILRNRFIYKQAVCVHFRVFWRIVKILWSVCTRNGVYNIIKRTMEFNTNNQSHIAQLWCIFILCPLRLECVDNIILSYLNILAFIHCVYKIIFTNKNNHDRPWFTHCWLSLF
jgi:hypothetical protein